jgi:hypothetical protein
MPGTAVAYSMNPPPPPPVLKLICLRITFYVSKSSVDYTVPHILSVCPPSLKGSVLAPAPFLICANGVPVKTRKLSSFADGLTAR